MLSPPSLVRSFQVICVVGFLSLLFFFLHDNENLSRWRTSLPSLSSWSSPTTGEHLVRTIETLTDYLFDYPLSEADFGQMSRRTEILAELVQLNNSLSGTTLNSQQKETISSRINRLALSLFPFLPNEDNPLDAVSQNIQVGSRGIVIPVGLSTFRYA